MPILLISLYNLIYNNIMFVVHQNISMFLVYTWMYSVAIDVIIITIFRCTSLFFWYYICTIMLYINQCLHQSKFLMWFLHLANNLLVSCILYLKYVFQIWLNQTCHERGWDHKSSPLVWRELIDRGGKGVLIGGASDFQEYVKGYYGLESDLKSDDMRKVGTENFKTKEVWYDEITCLSVWIYIL